MLLGSVVNVYTHTELSSFLVLFPLSPFSFSLSFLSLSSSQVQPEGGAVVKGTVIKAKVVSNTAGSSSAVIKAKVVATSADSV